MNNPSFAQFRLRDAVWLVALVAIALGWAVNRHQQQQSMRTFIDMVQREAPWIKTESPGPDWRESTLRPDEYRLTVNRVLNKSDQMVVMLTIETLQPQWHAIWSRGTTWFGQGGGHAVSGTIDLQRGPNAHGDNYSTGSDTLTATQISYQDKQLARTNLGGGSTTMEVPLKTPMNRVLEITAKDGIYSLHEPIVIGSAFGVDIKLVVGERAKVDAISETATDSSVTNGDSK